MRFYIDGAPSGLSQMDCRFLDTTRNVVQDWQTQALTAGGDGVSYYADVAVPLGAQFIDWGLTGQAQSLGYPEQIDIDPETALPIPPIDAISSLAAPRNLVAQNGESAVQLMWQTVQGATGYNVYKSVDGGAYVKQNTAPVANPVYTEQPTT